MAQTKLLPFRDYNEHDVINLFAFSGTLPAYAGCLVKTVASGWRTDDTDTQFLGSVGATFANTVSQRYGVLPAVTPAGTGDNVIGMTLWDTRETDENGELLKFKPRKQAELQCVLSGQAVPIVTRGVFLISGSFNGSVTAGSRFYSSGNGDITTSSTNAPNQQCGKFLGAPSAAGAALIYLNII